MENVFRLGCPKGIQLPNWKEFENTPTRRIKGKFDSLVKIRKFRESIPDWLDRTGCDELEKIDGQANRQQRVNNVIIRQIHLK